MLAFELDPHSQFEMSKFFLRTGFVRIPLEIVAVKELYLEALHK